MTSLNLATRATCLFLALLFSLIPIVSAQEGKGAMSLQFLAFPKQLQPEPLELRVGTEKTIQVATPGHELSPRYKVPELATISVGETVQDEEDKPVFKVYGQAKSVAPEQIILLIRKGKAKSDGFHVIPVDSRLPNFGGANFLFLNASNFEFAVAIGDKKFTLQAGDLKIVKPKPNHPPNTCQVTLLYKQPERETWKKFYDTRWPANEKTRSLVFFYRIPGTDRVGLAPVLEVINKHRPQERR